MKTKSNKKKDMNNISYTQIPEGSEDFEDKNIDFNTDDGMFFIPISGVQQIGMNLNLFGYKNKWLICDVGISFKSILGTSYNTLPSFEYLKKIGEENILGYIITHAHQDHIGALVECLKVIKAPIYTTKFTMKIIEEDLKQNHIKTTLNIVETNKEFQLNDFKILFSNITHSIPDTNNILIKTPAATIFHTGDWKFDDDPVIGQKTDYLLLKSIGEKYKITGFLCDSTNANENTRTGSEMEVAEGLYKIALQYPKNRLIYTSFASNVARLVSLDKIAKKTGRYFFLIGRSMIKMANVAISTNLIDKNQNNFIFDAHRVNEFPPEKVMIACTGSQGEMNSVLYKLAFKFHKDIKITNKDVVVFSARVIPGNEEKITDIKNYLISQNVTVIDERDEIKTHVSGHPGRQEIAEMVEMINPYCVIPIHGDLLHLKAAENLMKIKNRRCLVPPFNGAVFRLKDNESVKYMGQVPVITNVIDGKQIYPINGEVFQQRKQLSSNGIIVINIKHQKNISIFIYGVLNDNDVFICRENILKIVKKNISSDKKLIRNDVIMFMKSKYSKIPYVLVL
ncbi:hypothetical protein AB836_00390 [Rickettsiales bacterium (ex Bugula neritina AB1)]|nr:hypothetical protein AB836_00390 [Rickettsiales bacterium (ex Bugula neritina AB1)]